MKNREKLIFGLAIGLGAFAPFSYAEVVTGKNGMEACAEALMVSINQDSQYALEYKVKPIGSGVDSRLGRSEVIYLDAKLGDDNIIAKANCRVNGNAEVVALDILSENAPEARRRAL